MKKDYNISEIRRLLDAFYDGRTTVEEERMLDEFFTSSRDLPQDLEADRRVFLAAKADCCEMDDDDIEDFVANEVDALSARAAHRVVMLRRVTEIAAMFIVAVSIALFAYKTRPDNVTVITDPYEAEVVTYKALNKISKPMDKALSQLNEANDKLQEIDEKINKQQKQ
jgi:hypothetical protein